MAETAVIIIPAVLAVGLSLLTKRIFLGLFVGIWSAYVILAGGNIITGLVDSLDGLVAVLASDWNAKILIFTALMGGLVALMKKSGGFSSFLKWLEGKANVKEEKRAQSLVWLTGVIIFFDQVTSQALTGSLGQGLADKYKFSREKLAYIVDSTATPMNTVLPINSWGAYIVGILAGLGVTDSIGVLAGSIPYNFYSIIAIILVMVVIKKSWNIGPMKKFEQANAEAEAKKTNEEKADEKDETLIEGVRPTPGLMLIPLLVFLIFVPLSLYITGDGAFTDGNASTALYWSIVISIGVGVIYTIKQGGRYQSAMKAVVNGSSEMIPFVCILLFAFAFSSVLGELGLGGYVANLTELYVPAGITLFLVYITSCLMAFSTGSSWGTFAIMTPIIVPMATTLGISISPFLGAMLSGAIFGDHSTPYSDSTVLASSFSGTDNVDHVVTQMPYTLTACGLGAILFLVVGFIIA